MLSASLSTEADLAHEAAFLEHCRKLTGRYYGQLCLFMAATMLVWWPIDAFFFASRADIVDVFSSWRLQSLVGSLVGVATSRFHRASPRWTFTTFTALLAYQSGIYGHACAQIGGIDEPVFHACYLMSMFTGALIAPLGVRVVATVLTMASFFVAYFVTAPQHADHPQLAPVLTTLGFAVAGTIGLTHIIFRLLRTSHRQRREIAARADRLEEVDRLKNELFANVSHELRTPLTLILAALRKIRVRGGDEVTKPAESGLRNAARLLVLINDLLQLSKLDNDPASRRLRRTDMARLTREVSANFRGSDPGSVTVSTPEAPVWALVDPRQLRTALYNLLSNAQKFTAPDGCQIEVTVDADDDEVRIAVEDNGCGIASEDIQRIFERFAQLSGGATREKGGTGIGLSLVRAVAQAHAGEVTVESELGRGSRFVLTVARGTPGAVSEEPLDADVELATLHELLSTRGAPASGEASPRLDERPTALVADDDDELREYVAEILAQRFAVSTASNGEEALASVRREPPDLVVLDVMMPKRSGIDVVAALRAEPGSATLPVLLLTARVSTEARVEAYRAGADDYLTKPFQEEELLARAQNLYVVRRQEQRLKHEVAQRTESLRSLAAHLETQSEQERRRIGREIHDASGQSLTAMQFELSLLRRRLVNHAGLIAILDRVDELLAQTVESNRRIIADLRPAVLDDLGLGAAAEWYLRRFSERAEARVDWNISPHSFPADPSVETAAFRTLQEALTNVTRHARAERVRVEIGAKGGRVHVRVEDDGVGFDPGSRSAEGFGILGMKERAQALGGELVLTSAKGQGTVLSMQLPVSGGATMQPRGAVP